MKKGDMIIFGCGGSDILVLVLGVVFYVEYIDIFIDVEGVMIVDFCIVKDVCYF